MMDKPRIDNVLASRYATAAMCDIWSPRGKIALERDLWIAVMRAQAQLGLPISSDAIAAYERVKDDIRTDRIGERERVLRHDVKARIEEFNALAGAQEIHKGMTSRDLTDNVEQLQVLRALRLLRGRATAALRALRERAESHRHVILAARTHNVAAQPTTVGRRMAMYGEGLLLALERLEELIDRYPLRGIAGAVGTAVDQATLLGDADKVARLNREVMRHLGFRRCLDCSGQVYPRSLDFDVVTAVAQLASAPADFARTLRLMAGQELAHEGFQKGQVGSSAMPHKMNARSCERINGLDVVIGGYVTMTSALRGNQWNEGDVSCSVVRRVALPDAMLAADGLLETFLVVLTEAEFIEPMIERELERMLPFLATTRLMMEAVQRGMGREAAHAAVRGHALDLAEARRTGDGDAPGLPQRLGEDASFPLSQADIEAALADRESFVGIAQRQIDAFVTRARAWETRYPQEAAYRPGAIL